MSETQDLPVNPLFDNLVPAHAVEGEVQTRSERVSFTRAMGRMNISSVFDIIRQPKETFTRTLATLSDADGALAYDNAMCYAIQIGRSYREEHLCNDHLPASAPVTGVRALVDIGPSYPNLFKENWDAFCKVGAIEAMDGPVAYLGSLRRFAEEKIEGKSTSPARIPLALRRPDLDKLVIDENSTYTPRPMLELVNEVLKQSIQPHLNRVRGMEGVPLNDALEGKIYPFIFPFTAAHRKTWLALAESVRLGEVNYKTSAGLPFSTNRTFGSVQQSPTAALRLATGLSPNQQKLLITPSPFATYQISYNEADNIWYSSMCNAPLPLEREGVLFTFPAQPGLVDYHRPPTRSPVNISNDTFQVITKALIESPSLRAPSGSGHGWAIVNLKFTLPDQTQVQRSVCMSSKDYYHRYLIPGHQRAEYSTCISLFLPDDAVLEPDLAHARADFYLGMKFSTSAGVKLNASISMCLGESYTLRDAERQYLADHLGSDLPINSAITRLPLNELLQSLGLTSEQFEPLISSSLHTPYISARYTDISEINDIANKNHLPWRRHYGANYVNGVGALSHESTYSHYHRDNSITVAAAENGQPQVINLSLNRLDRLQRMVRLQRWVGIAFTELDTLIISAIRAEGSHNLTMEMTTNTLRALGAYRQLSNRRRIDPEEFGALLHDLCVFGNNSRQPLLDRVFGGIPLALDGVAYGPGTGTEEYEEPELHKATVAQLCAGLGLIADDHSYYRLEKATLDAGISIKRNIATVSSLYRQARIAQLFNLSAEDSWGLIGLLGGADYLKAVAKGNLKAVDETTETGVDILDILMEMDWVVNWLDTTGLTVSQLRQMVGKDNATSISGVALLHRLEQLRNDAGDALISDEELKALKLPSHTPATTPVAINWKTELSTTLLTPGNELLKNGQVGYLGFTERDAPHSVLSAAITVTTTRLKFTGEAARAIHDKLIVLLMGGHQRQAHLLQALFQEWAQLSADRTESALQLAGTSSWKMFKDVMALVAPITQLPAAFNTSLQDALRCAQAVQHLGCSEMALRTFITAPTLLDTTLTAPLRLNLLTFYLLDRYQNLLKTQGIAEQSVLDYLVAAQRTGNDAVAMSKALAPLIGWVPDEICTLVADLPDGKAKTMADIDWVIRCQHVCASTGLSANTLLMTTNLNLESPYAEWETVGEAALAGALARQ